jgi:hypothetical protein
MASLQAQSLTVPEALQKTFASTLVSHGLSNASAWAKSTEKQSVLDREFLA